MHTTLLERIKPTSSRATRLMLASLMWLVVGAGLLIAGWRWTTEANGMVRWAVVLSALALGVAKGRYVLAPRAHANAARISRSGESRCVGGLISWRAWILVLAMMAVGAGLRHSPLPRLWLGGIYLAVGSALAGASLASWRYWQVMRRR